LSPRSALDFSKRKHSAVWFVTLLALGFLFYYPGIDVQYYADDFYFLQEVSCSNVVGQFLGQGRSHSFYRPVEAAVLACVQANFDLNTIPIHVVTIVLHVALSYLLFVAILEIGLPLSHAILGSLFLLFSQANASAILGNDTLSQVSGTYFGCLSLFLLYRFLSGELSKGTNREVRVRLMKYVLSVLAFTIALFSKESSVSFFPLLFGVALLKGYALNATGKQFHLRKAFLFLLPYFTILVAYLTVRNLVGTLPPRLGPGPYNFHIGLSILKNAANLLLAANIPVSTVTTVTNLRSGRLDVVALILFLTILFIGFVGYGAWHSRRSGLLLALVAFGIVAMFPMVMLNHISELYAYNLMPFVATIFGIGVGTLVQRASRGWRRVTIAAVLLLLTGHVVAIRQKASMMRENGIRATVLLEKVRPYAEKTPAGGALMLVNSETQEPEYSVFLTRGFNVLAASRVEQVARRDDITVKIIEESELRRPPPYASNTLFLYLTGDGLGVTTDATGTTR